jgi:predicted DNA-binding transcriptional regulator AlpA
MRLRKNRLRANSLKKYGKTHLAALTGYTPGYIRQLVFKRKIPFYKTENLKPVRFKKSEILSWITDRKYAPIYELADNYLEEKKIKLKN